MATKACVDCKHFRLSYRKHMDGLLVVDDVELGFCVSPNRGTGNRVTGETRAFIERSQERFDYEKGKDGGSTICGPEGLFFEQETVDLEDLKNRHNHVTARLKRRKPDMSTKPEIFEKWKKKAEELGVRLIEPIEPSPMNKTIAVCGKCGLEIKAVMGYVCSINSCPVFLKATL